MFAENGATLSGERPWCAANQVPDHYEGKGTRGSYEQETYTASVVLLAALAGAGVSYRLRAELAAAPQAGAQRGGPPTFQLDPSWPPKLPNGWVMGVPTWVTVDKNDHVWVLNRPRTVPADQKANAAPSVIEFDPAGKFLQAWGGPGQGYDWPDTEHGIFVDHKDRVWITGINPNAGADVPNGRTTCC